MVFSKLIILYNGGILVKKTIGLLGFVFMMSFGGTALAAGSNVADCAHMDKGKCVPMCAKNMRHGVSECATSPCQMTDCN